MRSIRPLIIAVALALTAGTAAAQTTFNVTTEAGLRTAITSAAAGDRIVLGADISLTTGDLPAVFTSITIDGGSHTLSGNNQYRGLMVAALGGGATPVAVAVTIQNLTITNTLAKGGDGGTGSAGGGGGGGLGSGLFVAAQANVTLSNVNFASNQARGGNGGTGAGGAPQAGGGGGLGGNGGTAGATIPGGGGGAGTGANGGSNSAGGAGILTGGAAGGNVPLGPVAGGPQGGGGGSSTNGAGGGGSAGAPGSSFGPGGNGGYGGGGGGGYVGSNGGPGGVGGGGGGSGTVGVGGYGGGGGGNDRSAATVAGGFGGGTGGGNTSAGGGGGAALGGGIFVEGGGTIAIGGPVAVNGNTVTGGSGAVGGTNGSAFGAGMFFGGTGTVTFTSAAGETQRLTDAIGDERGSGGAGQYDLKKTGAGTLVLAGSNTYSGGTTITGGTVSVAAAANLGSGNVTVSNANLAITGTSAFAQNVDLIGAPTLNVSSGQNATLNGIVSGNTGSLNVNGGGTLTLGNAANIYVGGTSVYGNTTVVIGADGALGAAAGAVALGDATTSGTLGLTVGTTINTSRAFTIGAGGGAIDAADKSTATLNTGLTGAGLFTKNGLGTVVLAGAGTQTGGTLVTDGVLRAGIANAFGSGAMQLAAPATLDLNGFNQTVGSLGGAGAVTLGGATLDAGSNNTSTLFSGNMSGAGAFVKSGSGVMTLSGTNSYSGGTTVAGGTLAGTTASLQGSIRNDAAVIFDQTTAGTYAGAMSGTGTLTKSGTGVVTLSGPNTYTGGTVVNGGALAGTTTSLQGNIANNALVQFNQAANGTYAGGMSGTGTLAKSGTGTLTLSGTNTYTGGTMISAGTLAGDSRGIQGDILNDAQLVFNQGFDGSYAGNMAGTGALTKTGTGTLTLTGQASYTGGTLINAGTLAGNTLNLQGAIQDDAAILFNQSFDGIFNGTITGTGSLTKSGTGAVVLTGPQTYSGGTVVTAGALVGDDTSLRGGIVNNAQVVFAQAATGVYAGVMSGSGTLVKTGAGTLTLTGANTYAGGTLIANGTLAGDTSSIQGAIVNDARLVFNQNTNGIFSGGIAGSGSLTKNGAGTLTLAGPASYTGGTTITAGTLAGSSLSLQGNIRNDAALLFNQTFAGTFTGAISGTGSLTKAGSGALFMNGVNSYTGGTFVNGGSLIGTTSSLQGSIFNNALVEFSQNTSGTYGGTMSGTGSLVKSGGGTVTLTGTNSYAGGTAISSGALSIGVDAALGAAAGAVILGDALSTGTLIFTNNALLSSARAFTLGAGGGVFDTSGAAVTLSNGVTGAGGLTKTGQGVLELAGTGSYAGGTSVVAGTLRSGATNAFGTGNALVIGSGASVDLNGFDQTVGSIAGSGSLLLGRGTLTTGSNGSSGLFAGAITGTGSLVKTGGGTLLLSGANGYTGGTRVLGGALVGNTTSLQGSIFNNAVVQFDQGTNGTYAGSMSGSGVLAKTGAGVLTLTGTNTYSGGTLIDGGSLVGTATSLRGLIVNNAQLTFGGASDGLFAGTLTGSGSLIKTGTGTLTLNGTQPLTGLFTVAQGTLALNGIFGGSIDVAAGAALRANGTIAGSLNLAGSLFAVPPPAVTFALSGLTDAGGAAIQGPSYLTIGRDLTAFSGSVLDFAIGPGATPTILVGGTAALNGARFNVSAPDIGSARSASFLALATLNGLSLSNTQVTTGDAGVIPILKQDRNSLFVTLLNLNVPLRRFAGPGTISIADAIDRSKFNAGGDGGLVIRELTALDDRGLQDALEQIGGQLHASVLQTAILDSENVTDLIRDQLSAREMEDGDDVRWWGETACQHADFKGTATARGGHTNVCAGAGGADRRFSERWTLGGGGSYTGGSMGLGNMGSGDYTSPRAFGYVGYKPSRLGFRGGGSAAKSNYRTERQITFRATLPPELGAQPLGEGVNRKAESEQQGATKDAWSEIHDSRKMRSFTVEGLLGVRHATISRASFLETGAISLSLDGGDETLALTQTDFKVHAFRREGTFRPFFDMNYRRELAAGRTEANVKFTGLPNSEFIVEGINVPASSYHTRAGLTFATLVGQATFTYEYKQAPGQRRQTASLRFRFK